jgi:hypothetical protein
MEKQMRTAMAIAFKHGKKCILNHPDDNEYDNIYFQRAVEEMEKKLIETQDNATLAGVSNPIPCERCKKLEFMVENGLGWKDMDNDCT